MSLLTKTVCSFFCVTFVATMLAFHLTGDQRNAPQDDDVRLYMRAKLTSSQKLMEGLVTENFTMIKAGADEMSRLSKGASWPQAKDAVYNHFNTSFQNQCEEIKKLSDAKNLQGVKFAYLQLTTTCVDCHSYVRKRFTVKPPLKKKGPVQLIPTYWDDDKK